MGKDQVSAAARDVHRELKNLGRIIESTATQVEDAHIKIAVLTGEVEALRQEVRAIAAKT